MGKERGFVALRKGVLFLESYVHLKKINNKFMIDYLETECRLFPPVRIFLYLFLRAGYFFNAFD